MAIISQGRFTSDGNTKVLQIRSDLDWLKVYNVTIAAANQTTAIGVEYYWQRGFPAAAMWEYKKSSAANAANLSVYSTSGGFTLVDSSVQAPAVLNNGSTGISAISTAAIPVATVGSTTGMSAGNVVRIYNTPGALQLGGLDFTVGYNTFGATSFSLDYMSQLAAAGTPTGSFRVIPFDPIYYPRRRFITKITQAAQAVVTLSVTHGYYIGQEVSFRVPSEYGMVEMDGLTATIVDIDTTTTSGNSITVNVDSSAFTAFAFPASGIGAFTPAQVVPVGEDTAYALNNSSASPNAQNILSDATNNLAYIGVSLAAGANSPAGQNNDVIYWVAGKSDSIDNQ